MRKAKSASKPTSKTTSSAKSAKAKQSTGPQVTFEYPAEVGGIKVPAAAWETMVNAVTETAQFLDDRAKGACPIEDWITTLSWGIAEMFVRGDAYDKITPQQLFVENNRKRTPTGQSIGDMLQAIATQRLALQMMGVTSA